LMENGKLENCDDVKYDFTLGPVFLKSSFGRPVDYNTLSIEDKSKAVVEPGEVVFVMADENIRLPSNVFALLSQKRKMSMAGISVVGGDIIDPGYKGKMIFGLLNFASEPFTLLPGKKLIAATFSELQDNEIGETIELATPPEPITEFSPELIERMIKFSPISMQSMREQVREIKNLIYELQKTNDAQEFSIKQLRDINDKVSRDVAVLTSKISELTDNVNKTNSSVISLEQSLKLEIANRESGEREIQSNLLSEISRRENGEKMLQNSLSSIKWMIGISVATATVILAAVTILIQLFG